ncbi:MAG: hypothetical protein GY777_32670 [Candidatus Brocadiaceae bacterium]|nr:hypothetical protein [Candidatus Brocadiaceae bacterium]
MFIKFKKRNKVRNAVLVGLYFGLFYLFITIYALINKPDGKLSYYNDPLLLLEVVIIFGLTYGIFKYNRYCAILMFIYILIGLIETILEPTNLGKIIITLVFLYFLFEGILGTFAHHKEKSLKEEKQVKRRWWLIVVSVLGVILFTFFYVEAMFIKTGYLPDTCVVKGTEMPTRQLSKLKEMHLGLEDDEEVKYFYSTSIISIKEGGCFFTNKKVIVYENLDGKLFVDSADFKEINDIVEVKGNYLDDTVIYILKEDDESLYLSISTESNLDEVFFSELLKLWKSKKNDPA